MFDFGRGAGSHTVTYASLEILAVPLDLGLQVAETTIPAFAVLDKNMRVLLSLAQCATTGARSIWKTVSKSGSRHGHWEMIQGALG